MRSARDARYPRRPISLSPSALICAAHSIRNKHPFVRGLQSSNYSWRDVPGSAKIVYDALINRWSEGNAFGRECSFDIHYLVYITGSLQRAVASLRLLFARGLVFYPPSPANYHPYDFCVVLVSSADKARLWMMNHRLKKYGKQMQDGREVCPLFEPPICKALLSNIRSSSPNQDEAGVYIIKDAAGHYKIGCTSNVSDRLRMFGVKLPFEIELEHFIPTVSYRALERKLHRQYKSKKIRGEWYKLEPEDVQAIKDGEYDRI